MFHTGPLTFTPLLFQCIRSFTCSLFICVGIYIVFKKNWRKACSQRPIIIVIYVIQLFRTQKLQITWWLWRCYCQTLKYTVVAFSARGSLTSFEEQSVQRGNLFSSLSLSWQQDVLSIISKKKKKGPPRPVHSQAHIHKHTRTKIRAQVHPRDTQLHLP